MKSFSLALLVATVAAETGYTCVNLEGDAAWTDPESDTIAAATTADACTAAAKTIAEADETKDFCASFTNTAEIAEDADADPPVTADDARAASTECALLRKATAADADIREAKATEDTITYDAWAWVAGAALADLTVAEEETTTDTTTVVEELLGATALYQGFAASAIMVAMMA